MRIKRALAILLLNGLLAAGSVAAFAKTKEIKMKNTETAILAGGCFWGMEDILRKLPGVLETEVGYTGGHTPNPTYKDVKTGTTGHA